MQKVLETKAALQTAESRNKQQWFHFITAVTHYPITKNDPMTTTQLG